MPPPALRWTLRTQLLTTASVAAATALFVGLMRFVGFGGALFVSAFVLATLALAGGSSTARAGRCPTGRRRTCDAFSRRSSGW